MFLNFYVKLIKCVQLFNIYVKNVCTNKDIIYTWYWQIVDLLRIWLKQTCSVYVKAIKRSHNLCRCVWSVGQLYKGGSC